jgi:hypothetical protein
VRRKMMRMKMMRTFDRLSALATTPVHRVLPQSGLQAAVKYMTGLILQTLSFGGCSCSRRRWKLDLI